MLRLPWYPRRTNTREPAPARAPRLVPDPEGLRTCPQCRHCTGLLDEHWLTITGTADSHPRATVCSPRCAVLWLEATYRPTALGVAL